MNEILMEQLENLTLEEVNTILTEDTQEPFMTKEMREYLTKLLQED